ncbi:MAG TPA: ABC transporter permease [Candidatus Acidoferrales bacterium]|nr:ABC transporter permease [Candidatus Acidoferrales bacterium]
MNWISRLFCKSKLDNQLDSELCFHIEQQTADNIAAGMNPDEARRRALAQFGGLEYIKEETRDARGTQFIDSLLQDIRFALRMLRKSPGFTIVAILTLALGIGANTAIFSVADTLLLRSLPFHRPDRVALLQNAIVQNSFPPHDTAKQFHEWAQHSSYLADAVVYEGIDANLGGGRGAIRAHVVQTSSNFFSVLGVRPVSGSAFVRGDEVDATGFGLPGRNAVAVIGYGLWQELFGGDPKALGETISVDGNRLTVIGVAPPGFDYPDHCVLWKPAAFSRGNNGWVTIARLKSGISWGQARAAFAVEVAPRRPKSPNIKNSGPAPQLLSLRDGLLGPVKNATLLLLGAVLLVLLIACTNLANLLIARTADRRAELSIRIALGASRARLARQLLTECLLLSSVAAVAGLLAAYWTVPLAAIVEPPPMGVRSYSVLNGDVLVFTLAASVIAALLFGLLPVLDIGNLRVPDPLPSATIRGSRVIRQTVMAAQVTLTIVLLSASVMVGHAFAHLMSTDRGYNVKGIATVSVSLDDTTYQSGDRQLPYFEEVLERLRRLPGVLSVSATEFLPLYAKGFIGGSFGIDDHPAERNSMMVPVFADYFETMGGRILYGREFNDAEVRSDAKVAVVSEGFAASFGEPSHAIGRRLTNAGGSSWQIVGVVKGMNYGTEPTLVKQFQVFIPPTHPGIFPAATIVARVDAPAVSRLAAIRDTIRSADPRVPVFNAKTTQQRLDEIFVHQRFYRFTIWAFTGFALLLILVGTYGLLSYTVARRTSEIGVRVALGATRSNIGRMVLGQAFLTVFVGILSGAPLIFWVKRLAASLMGSAPGSLTAPIAFGSVAILVVALLAAYIPARRAMQVDPMVALRQE